MKPTILWVLLGIGISMVLILEYTVGAADLPRSPEVYGMTTRVNIASDGTEANYYSYTGDISDDGRWVTFASFASNLVAGDEDIGSLDIFLHDRQSGQTERLSVNHEGIPGDGDSNDPVISGDGNWVAFFSDATNLVSGDTNNARDLFLWERATGTLQRISVSSTGAQGSGNMNFNSDAAFSDDGNSIAFISSLNGLVAGDTNGWADLFVHDRMSGETIRVSISSTGEAANNESASVDISADGRYLSFRSWASNLVPDDHNGQADVFVHDRQTGQTERISQRDDGSETTQDASNPSISGDGRFVAFQTTEDLTSGATTEIPSIYLYDRVNSTIALAVTRTNGERAEAQFPRLSADGQFLLFSSSDSAVVVNDTNEVSDVFRHDFQMDHTERVSLSSYDEQGNGSSTSARMSSEGQYVVWNSFASNLVENDQGGWNDIFVREELALPLPTRTPTSTSTPTATLTPTLTPTPRIPPYPNEQFLPLAVRQNKLTDAPFLMNITAHGNGASFSPVTSQDGSVVAFVSDANNLVPSDTNGQSDIFVWERATQQITRVSVSSTGAQLADRSERPSISENGQYIVYTAWADRVVPEDTNGKADIYRYDRLTEEVLLVSVSEAGGGGDDNSVHADVSGDGNVVVFISAAHNLNAGGTPGVPTGKSMGFVRNLTTNTTTLLRYNGTGNIFQDAAWPSISDDGTKIGLAVWFTPGYCTGQPIARIDVATGATETIASTTVNHHWELLPNAPRISPDGTQVGYRYYANGTVNSGYFLLVGGANGYALTTLPVPGEGCGYFSGNSQEMAFSANGQRLAFTSLYLPSIPGDNNGVNDIFLWDTLTQQATWLSKPAGGLANGHSYDAYISGDGRTVYFASDATNLVSGDTNGVTDLFVWMDE
jgi:hypothetical protein